MDKSFPVKEQLKHETELEDFVRLQKGFFWRLTEAGLKRMYAALYGSKLNLVMFF